MRTAPAIALGFALGLICAACKSRGAPAADEQVAPPGASALQAVQIVSAFGTCFDRDGGLEACVRDCDAKNADACRRLGATFQFAKPPDKNEARATRYYEEACGLESAPACLSAGQMYEFAHGVAKDDVRAAGFYQRSCDLGDMAGCANWGIMLENGRGTAKDLDAAARLYDRACRGGAGLACERLSVIRRDGGR